MFKVAAALVLVLLAALQVALANNPPIVLGLTGKHSDAAKEEVRQGWAERDDVSGLLSALLEPPLPGVEDGKRAELDDVSGLLSALLEPPLPGVQDGKRAEMDDVSGLLSALFESPLPGVEDGKRAEMDDVSGLLSAFLESPLTAVEEGKSTRFVLKMPYLPTIIYFGGVSMSLIDISIEIHVEWPIVSDHFPKTADIIIPIKVPSMSFTAGTYVAGGKLNNLPFVGTGSSSAKIAMTNLNISVSYEPLGSINICPKTNTTHFEMTLDRLSMNFEDLNPGQDSGDLINAMLSSVTEDFTKLINILMDKPAALDLLERLIRVILSQLPLFDCQVGHSSDDKRADDLDGGLGSHGNSLAEFTKILENMLSGRLEIPEEGKELLELVGDLLPEMDLFNADFTQ